jgi:hypothetical protein
MNVKRPQTKKPKTYKEICEENLDQVEEAGYTIKNGKIKEQVTYYYG